MMPGSSDKPVHPTLEEAVAHEQHRTLLEKAQEVAHIGSWVAELDGSERLSWSAETYRVFGVSIGDFPAISRRLGRSIGRIGSSRLPMSTTITPISIARLARRSRARR